MFSAISRGPIFRTGGVYTPYTPYMSTLLQSHDCDLDKYCTNKKSNWDSF